VKSCAGEFARDITGQLGPVSLPSYQQALLNGMDRTLEARDPRLASMFAIFTRLTRDDGPPRTERLAVRPSLAIRACRSGARLARASATIPVVLVAGLMAAIIALGILTSSGAACPSTALRQVGQFRTSVCQTAAHG
jgi:hypothetical protein